MSDNLWNNIINNLKISINPQDVDIWFGGSNIISSTKERILIEFDDSRKKTHVENHFFPKLTHAIYEIIGKEIKIDLVSYDGFPYSNSYDKNKTLSADIPSSKPLVMQKTKKDYSLNQPTQTFPSTQTNPNFTFPNFVVGSHNDYAHAAALSVAQNPGLEFNPLFIWGGVGLGKTHLLQAIAQKLQKEKEYLKVLYVHSETFINEIVDAILKNQTTHFKLKYRYVDILLIDDIQFIQGKEKTQTEFFHTFNALYESGRQIVISSDRPPNQLLYLTDRISNRFQWGLITKISPPDLETRKEIIKQKAKNQNISIPDEIMYYIAKNIKGNIRSLEGAILTIKLHQNQYGLTPSLSNIDSILREYIQTNEIKKQYSASEIIEKVAKHYSISAKEITSKSRINKLIIPRFISIYLISEMTSLTTKEIGYHLGGRDHSTIINARKEIDKKLTNDKDFHSILESIKSSL